jgi:enoyl-CoA hydratase
MSTVLVLASDGVAHVILNRPESRNALNLLMCEELCAAMRRLADDASVRVAIVRAHGPVFCAGADLTERQGMSARQALARRIKAFEAYQAIESFPKPAIAVVQGACVGSGCEIAACCDFIYCSGKASFRVPEALWGTVGATQRLPRILGKRLAKEMLYTGRALSADEALEAGLVNRVLAEDRVMESALEAAHVIAKAPAGSIALAKRCIDRGVELDPKGALALEIEAIEENLAAADWKSNIAEFGKKPEA